MLLKLLVGIDIIKPKKDDILKIIYKYKARWCEMMGRYKNGDEL